MKAYGVRDKKIDGEKVSTHKRSVKKTARQFLKKTVFDDGLCELRLPIWMSNGAASNKR